MLCQDSEFPANQNSLFCDGDHLRGHDFLPDWPSIVWRRAADMRPRFFDESCAGVVVRSALTKTNWLSLALDGIASERAVLTRLFVSDSRCMSEDGKVTIRLTIAGVQEDVVIDDRLPCYPDGQLVFSSSSTEDEAWVTPLTNH